MQERCDAVEARRSESLLALEAAERQLVRGEDSCFEDEPDTELRDTAAEHVDRVRSEEVDQRLALRTRRSARGRSPAGRTGCAARPGERQARARAAAAAATGTRGGDRAPGRRGARLAPRRTRVLAHGRRGARGGPAAGAGREAGLARGARAGPGGLAEQLATLTDAVHRDEVARAEAALRIGNEDTTHRPGHGLDELVAEFGRTFPLPPSAEMAEYEAAKERGEQVGARRRCPSTAPPSSARANAPSGIWPRWAR